MRHEALVHGSVARYRLGQRIVRLIDAALASRTFRFRFGVAALVVGAVAAGFGMVPNALILGFIGVYFLVSGWS